MFVPSSSKTLNSLTDVTLSIYSVLEEVDNHDIWTALSVHKKFWKTQAPWPRRAARALNTVTQAP